MLRRLAQAAAQRHGARWVRGSGSQVGVPPHVVDLRRDTVTKPGPAMRRAMAEAVVGDDNYSEDPTVRARKDMLVHPAGNCRSRSTVGKAAELLGVAQTLFVPTSTTADLISVMCHRRRRGSQVLLGRESHLHVYEQGGIAQIAGVHSHPLPDLPRGTRDLNELERMITRGLGSPYHPVCELICLENTQSSSESRVLSIDYLPRAGGAPLPGFGRSDIRSVCLLAQSHGVCVHLDGARLMNAAAALRVPPTRIVEHCDSVSLCFSKGLGAPVGSLVGGPKDFIKEAWHLRKAGGAGRGCPGGLAEAEEVLLRDRQKAQRFAQGLQDLVSPIRSVDLRAVETSMAVVRLAGPPPEELCRRLWAVSADEAAETGQAVRGLLP